MPSIKKRVTGFIRQLSAPGGPGHQGAGGAGGHGQAAVAGSKNYGRSPKPAEQPGGAQEGFIQRYLSNGEHHDPGPTILSGKTGHDLPVLALAPLSSEVFAAFTGPDGGVTSIARKGDEDEVDDGSAVGAATRRRAALPDAAAEDSGDFDFIDLEDLAGGSKSRRQSAEDEEQRENGEEAAKSTPTAASPSSWTAAAAPASGGSDNPGGSNNGLGARETVMKVQDRSSRSAAWQRRQRELSVENDYPELVGMDFPTRHGMGAVPGPPGASPSRTNGNTAAAAHLLTRRLKQDLRNDCETAIAGVCHWNRPNNAATGKAVTLYERHPHTAEHAGNPIADTFAVVARKNSAVMVLGDGVNWGARAALASRCAVHGAMETLNAALFAEVDGAPKIGTTQEVFQCLLRSFHAAHSLILQESAHLTTLTACVVIPVREREEDNERFVACVCNVGDSLAYVYSPTSGHVREITQGSHDISSNRDMRDALGALGPVDGINPELSNLTCSMTFVDDGDIVFLTSDGISDNFDPVVGKFVAPAREGGGGSSSQNGRHPAKQPSSVTGDSAPASKPANALPTVEAYQRHELTLLRMEDLLNHGSEGDSGGGSSNGNVVDGRGGGSGRVGSSAELCHRLIDFCQRLTGAKRRILEDPDLYPEHSRHALPDSDATRAEQKLRRRRVCEKLAQVPGKLDHATVVAFTVRDRRAALRNYGTGGSNVLPATSEEDSAFAPANNSSLLALRAPCASTEDLTCRESEDEDDDEDEGGGGEEGVEKDGVGERVRISREDATPTPSLSLNSDSRHSAAGEPSSPSVHCGSLAVTPVHHPRQDIDLCFQEQKKD